MTDDENTIEMDPRDIEPGTLIGFEPVGSGDVEEEVRDTGIVNTHLGSGEVLVEMEDDPDIQERVPYDRIRAIKTPTFDVELTDSGIELTQDGYKEEFMAAGTAAVKLAEWLEGRYGDENPISRALRTANAFASDVIRFSSLPKPQSAHGQIADIYLLAMASLYWGHLHRREKNVGGGDPEQFIDAGEAMLDIADSIDRQIGIRSARGDVDEIEYRFLGDQ